MLAAAMELVRFFKMIIKGNGNWLPRTSSSGPMQKQNAISIPNPVNPLINTVNIIARGITTLAFSISSAAETISGTNNSPARYGFTYPYV
jgi:hypothetical protein